MNGEAVHASPRKTGVIVLGGGLPKHHINNANMMRNGSDFAVYINTAQEFDGSDSGAMPDEAVSWGKIRGDATPVKVGGKKEKQGVIFGLRQVIFIPLVSLDFCAFSSFLAASL